MRRSIWLLVLAACDTSLDQRLAIVREPRVLAVVSEPAEAKPGATATYRALIASPDGPLVVTPSWGLCTASKPPTEDNAVADPCLGDGALIDLGSAATATGTIPGDACARFGPDVPGVGFRPRDADPTGGYYQPVRAATGVTDLAFGFTRITCNLPNAPGDLQRQYQLGYVANQNPALDVAVPPTVAAGSAVDLVAAWPPGAAESYLYYDVQAQTLVTRREAMRVSWFATAGTLDVDGSVVGEDDDATSVTTTWHAPATAGPAWLWFVLRDARGGIATQVVQIDVQ